MPSLLVHDIRPLSEREAAVYVASTCFKTGPPGSLGVEVERLVYDEADPSVPVPASRVQAALSTDRPTAPRSRRDQHRAGWPARAQLAAGRRPPPVSSRPRAPTCRPSTARSLPPGFVPAMTPWTPLRPPRRTLDLPRYVAMQQYFDRRGPAGHTMMCSTAALQVCVDAGLEGDSSGSAARRWRRLHRLAPVLVAMFANSPFSVGGPNGWRSGRQAVWLAIDPARTQPPSTDRDPRNAWAEYVLDAPLLCIRNEDGPWAPPPGLTMRSWLRGDGPRPATADDLDYHVSTLFPPVRPRGFLELRVLDAQPGSGWEVALAMVAALVEDERASDRAAEACGPVEELGRAHGGRRPAGLERPRPRHRGPHRAPRPPWRPCPVLAPTTRRTPGSASSSSGTPHAGRCPADDRLDGWRRTGLLSPFDNQEKIMTGRTEEDTLKASIAEHLVRADAARSP